MPRQSCTPIMVFAAAIFLATPALADCADEVASLESQVSAAETGAAPDDSGMPATQHQSEVLEGEQETMESSGTADSTTAPSSQHQEETLSSVEGSSDVAQLLEEAREHAEAGDQEACSQKLEEARTQLGE